MIIPNVIIYRRPNLYDVDYVPDNFDEIIKENKIPTKDKAHFDEIEDLMKIIEDNSYQSEKNREAFIKLVKDKRGKDTP